MTNETSMYFHIGTFILTVFLIVFGIYHLIRLVMQHMQPQPIENEFEASQRQLIDEYNREK